LPKGPAGIEYSGIMEASHEIPLIVGAYQKGIRDFDVQNAMKAMIHQQTTPGIKTPENGFAGNKFLESYIKLGYVPNEEGQVSNTLEYAYDDWCVSQFAKAIGNEDAYQQFIKRAANYKNVFDTSVKYIRMKHADGTWVKEWSPFCCTSFNGPGYLEGNAWQYSFFNPHDVQGWSVIAPAYKSARRYGDAANAYANVLRFSAPTADLYANYAEMLVYANGGMVTAEAANGFSEALKLEPRHADGHTAYGAYQSEVIDKVGGLVAGVTYGAKKDSAVEHYEKALKLFPESPITHIEYGNGLLMLFGKSKIPDATKLYEKAASLAPMDAMERLDVELAKSELE